MNYSLEELAQFTGGRILQAGKEIRVSDVMLDTRNYGFGRDTAFFAIETNKSDGHKYLKAAAAKGVKVFVVHKEGEKVAREFPGISVLLVKDTLQALQDIASKHREHFNFPVLGITGSNGKTIVKEWLFHLLAQDFNILRSPKSFNSQVGVPLSVLQPGGNFDIGIFEAGISLPGEMSRLENILKPQEGIFTNIGDPHQEGFSSLPHKVKEKLLLFKNSDLLIYGKDYRLIDEEVRKGKENGMLKKNLDTLTWSWQGNGDLNLEKKLLENKRCRIIGDFHGEEVDFSITFTDSASVENAIICWLYARHKKLDPGVIAERMLNLAPVEMRLELKRGINGCVLVNDSYNNDIHSFGIALDYLDQQATGRKKTVILSDILQSGKPGRELYSEVNKILLSKKVDRIIGIGPEISTHAGLFSIDHTVFPGTDQFLGAFDDGLFREEAILVKGAREFRFEKITRLLQEKAHRTILEVDLEAMVHNLNVYRSFLKPGTKLMAMVKAYSYGSGNIEVANILQYHKVDYLAVAYADEGVELRRGGINLPVMVLNPDEGSFDVLIRYNLEPEIYSLRQLDSFISFLNVQKITSHPVHIKLDTGMHRLGFSGDELVFLIERLKDNPHLRIKSVFSHLAASDDPNEDKFTRSQVEEFESFSREILDVVDYPVMKHFLNTAGILRFPEAQFDMVRLGIGLYGVDPTGETGERLKWVNRLKTRISQIKIIPPGDTIGYSRKGKALEEMRIATIGIGYADGFNRLFSNGKGYVMINGAKATVVGNVCMDMTMVDVTGIPCEEGDEVIVLGEDPDVFDWARKLSTIPYEVLTGISERVKRVYFK